ncbi:hypothetical protein D3C75_462480 [compost metagenome]
MKVTEWNKFLVTTVVLLLWLAVLVLIKVLFSNVNGFEWGSVTDWLSAGSSVITLIFAVYVYLSWQKEKYRDDAYVIQKQIITEHYPKIFNIIDELEFKLKNYNFRVNGHNHHLKDSVLDSMQTYLLDTITDLEVTTHQLTTDINIMKFFRYKPVHKFEKMCVGLTRIIELIIQSIKTIISCLRGLKMSEFEHVRRKLYISFNSMIPYTIETSQSLTEAKDYLFSSSLDLRKLFVNF